MAVNVIDHPPTTWADDGSSNYSQTDAYLPDVHAISGDYYECGKCKQRIDRSLIERRCIVHSCNIQHDTYAKCPSCSTQTQIFPNIRCQGTNCGKKLRHPTCGNCKYTLEYVIVCQKCDEPTVVERFALAPRGDILVHSVHTHPV